MANNLLPEKHVRTSESLIGLGAIVLSLVKNDSMNLDKLWSEFKKTDVIGRRIHGSVTLDKVVLTLDFLFSIGAVSLSQEGYIEHASD